MVSGDRDQHRPRARPQAREPRALAQQGRARAERLRALLHRAQPRPPRARRHARGPRQLAPRRELLRASCRAPSAAACARRGSSRATRLRRLGSSPWTPRNDILNAWAMTRRACSPRSSPCFGSVVLPYLLIQAVLGFSLLEVVNYLEHYGLLRQQPRGRPLRAHPPRAQLELQQRRLQRAALPPAAPLRPPRQPDAPLPGAAPLRRGAAAADRLRRHDRARLVPAAVAARHGPPRARPLRRRRDAREHPPAEARASDRWRRDGRAEAPPDGRLAARPAATSTTSSPATRARASRPARRGARCPTTGPARTAACATRSTSSRPSDVTAAPPCDHGAMAAGASARPTRSPAAAAARHAVRRRPRRAAAAHLGRHHDGRHRAAGRRQPPDALQGVRLARRVRRRRS